MAEREARELRVLRAQALSIAGMSQAGKAFDLQLLYALADDVMDYIMEGAPKFWQQPIRVPTVRVSRSR